MKSIANIKAFAANVAALVYINKNYNLAERTASGDPILYRVRELSNGDVSVEGFRASMADGDHKTFEGEVKLGHLWAGSKRLVHDYLHAKDRNSTELVPLMMHFAESKYEEFFIAEDRPFIEMVIRAELLVVAEEAVEA